MTFLVGGLLAHASLSFQHFIFAAQTDVSCKWACKNNSDTRLKTWNMLCCSKLSRKKMKNPYVLFPSRMSHKSFGNSIVYVCTWRYFFCMSHFDVCPMSHVNASSYVNASSEACFQLKSLINIPSNIIKHKFQFTREHECCCLRRRGRDHVRGPGTWCYSSDWASLPESKGFWKSNLVLNQVDDFFGQPVSWQPGPPDNPRGHTHPT